MKIKAILIPKAKLNTISLNATIREALEMIDRNNMLSLPVVDGERFVGALSKQFVYESYFKLLNCSREDFLDKKVAEFMFSTLPHAKESDPIDKAAEMFIQSKFRFIPVVNGHDDFVGIVTQQAVFKEYQKLFGSGYNSMTICFYDYQGSLARIAKIINKAGADIKNSVIMNTDTMGLHELFVRVECDDFEKLKLTLESEGYDVRC